MKEGRVKSHDKRVMASLRPLCLRRLRLLEIDQSQQREDSHRCPKSYRFDPEHLFVWLCVQHVWRFLVLLLLLLFRFFVLPRDYWQSSLPCDHRLSFVTSKNDVSFVPTEY